MEQIMQENIDQQSAGNRRKPRLIPLTEWPNYHPWPTVSGLRHLVFYSYKNGFDAVASEGFAC